MSDATQTRRLHPLLAFAAAAVILFSGIGIAKMMNWLPASTATAADGAIDNQAAAEAKAAEEKAAAAKKLADEKAAAAKKLADEKAAAAKAAAAKTEAKARAASTTSHTASVCASCGVITAVTPVADAAQPSGMGAIAGAIIGGVLGHQVGGGTGKKVATVAGAIGGAYAGNTIEGRTRSSTHYEVSVRFEDGRSDVFSYPTDPQVSVGERVRLESGQLVRR